MSLYACSYWFLLLESYFLVCLFTFEFVLDIVCENMIKRNNVTSKLALFLPNMISLNLFYLVLRVTSNLELSKSKFSA